MNKALRDHDRQRGRERLCFVLGCSVGVALVNTGLWLTTGGTGNLQVALLGGAVGLCTVLPIMFLTAR